MWSLAILHTVSLLCTVCATTCREKPKDVIQYLEEEGVVKLGELEVQDAIVFRAFEKEQILTTGNQHFEVG